MNIYKISNSYILHYNSIRMKNVFSSLLAKVVLDQEQGEVIGITLAVMILKIESITLCIIYFYFQIHIFKTWL